VDVIYVERADEPVSETGPPGSTGSPQQEEKLMSDPTRQQRAEESGGENRGVEEDVKSTGDEGVRSAQVTPPIADDAVHEQTQAPAPPDDVGVPSDDEIRREEDRAASGE
jgi:hypothetical protein